MQVSLQSVAYTVTCSIVATYNAYVNPAHWISCFVIGLFLGTCQGYFWRYAAETEVFRWAVKKETAVEVLTSSMPGLGITIINVIAMDIISKTIPFPSSWNLRIGTFVCDLETLYYGFAASFCGVVTGELFQLDMLKRSTDPEIQKFLEKAII